MHDIDMNERFLMKATVDAAQLASALKELKDVAGKYHSMPILASILLDCDGDGLMLSATDLEVSSFVRVLLAGTGATVPGRTVVSHAQLEKVLIGLAGRVVLAADRERDELLVVCGSFSARLQIDNLDDYPRIDVPDPTQGMRTVTVGSGALANAIERTLHSVAERTSNYNLAGLCLYSRDGRLRMVSSDSNHLVQVEFGEGHVRFPHVPGPVAEPAPGGWLPSEGEPPSACPMDGCSALVSVKAAGRLLTLARRAVAGDVLRLSFDASEDGTNRSMWVRCGARTLHVRLMEGKFPDPDSLRPSGPGACALMDVGSALAVMKKFMKFGGSFKVVFLNFEGDRLRFHMTVPNEGTVLRDSVSLEGGKSGARMVFGVDPAQMANVLSVCAKAGELYGKKTRAKAMVDYRNPKTPIVVRADPDVTGSWCVLSIISEREDTDIDWDF
jgi:hypothetical protein